MGGQRASFRVDRSGGLYQNNTFVVYMTSRRRNKADMFSVRKSSQTLIMLWMCLFFLLVINSSLSSRKKLKIKLVKYCLDR